jgi:hypothetical protein
MDESSGIALALKTGVPTYQVEDEEGRIHLLLHFPIEKENEDRWCLWRPDQAGFDSRSIFDGRWLRNKEAGVMEQWSVRLLLLRQPVRMQYHRSHSRMVPSKRPAA